MTITAPVAPVPGLKASDAPVVTVKVALALFVPSLTVTVFDPVDPEGTVYVAAPNLPSAPVVVLPPRVTALPLKVAVTVLPAANPEPLIVSVLPTGPWVGESVMIVAVTLTLLLWAL